MREMGHPRLSLVERKAVCDKCAILQKIGNTTVRTVKAPRLLRPYFPSPPEEPLCYLGLP